MDVLELFKKLFEPRLKIGVISYYYPFGKAVFNGVAVHVENLSRNLALLGCEVHIFARGDKHRRIKKRIGMGKIVVHSIPSILNMAVKDAVVEKRLRYIVFEHQIINEIAMEHAERNFAVIHTHGWLTSGAFISKFFNNIKWVHTFHAVEKNRLKLMSSDEKRYYKIANWIERTVVDADAVIAVSEYLKREACKTYKALSKKISVIPNGVDLKLFSPSYKNNSTILYVGRFSEEKGIKIVADIASEMLSENTRIKFIVVAPAKSLPSNLESTKKKLESLQQAYPKRMKLILEPQTRNEIASFYKQASIYVQPSYYESFGLSVAEAMACRKAVVASNVGGIPEVVGNAGLLSIPDAEHIKKSLFKLLDNPVLAKKLGMRAVERAQKFSWDKVAEKTLKLYKRIIGV